MRIFEGMGCGALVLTDNTPEQSELFENGVHYVLYDSQEDMLGKLWYYLVDHPDEAPRSRPRGNGMLSAIICMNIEPVTCLI